MDQDERDGNVRRRFWLESVAAGAFTLLFLMTLLWHDWLEIVFRIDPDHGNGALEWLTVCVSGALALGAWAMARAEWLRARPASA